ncbi:hypothetical protein [uncultured Clostridium sp.]|uniref:hypothetical protein n=1 Tax=uncultured Clostridium sp. TaxID=59620 RepID=UPI002672EB20|nr:hypothetical protein [uncultured Clostridium sp.]
MPECQYINGLKKVLCKTSQYGNQIAEDYENTGFLRSVFIVCGKKNGNPVLSGLP